MTRLSEHRARSARGKRTASAYSYSHQPPHPVTELTLPAEVQQQGDVRQSDPFALPATLPAFPDSPRLAALAVLPPMASAAILAGSRLKLNGLTLDERLVANGLA